ncbi:hypothetical protein [Phycobacter sp. K97]|uniref:hypothetical protein n=1 Tax=Phycobacter sedimenti TaxID=3133977 RepID=UPI00311D4D68
MPSISTIGGFSPSLAPGLAAKQPRPPEHSGQVGPPDHAKAWGWRAKQAAAAETAQPPVEPPSEVAEPAKVDALLSGSFGEISLKIENAEGEFKIEVSRDEDGLSVEIKAETDRGEIKIEFESGEHGGIEVEFEMGEFGEISLSVSNLDDSDGETAIELLEGTDDQESGSALTETGSAIMETMVLNTTLTAAAPSAAGAMSEYEKIQALFS